MAEVTRHSGNLPGPVPSGGGGGNEPEPLGHPGVKGGEIPFNQFADVPDPSEAGDSVTRSPYKPVP